MLVKSEAKNVNGVSREMLIQRARALVPALRERAPEGERLRGLPPATVQDFHDAGLFRILQPARVGGAEMDLGLIVDIGAEIGRGCASSAWVLGNLAVHHWQLGQWHEAMQDEVWGANPDALIGSSFVFPAGSAIRVDGGYRLLGNFPWPFNSGVNISEWSMLAAGLERESGEAPEPMLFMVHKSEYTVLDVWHASGLIASGSNDCVIEEVFLPEHRGLRVADCKGGPTPGSKRNPSPLYMLPAFATFPYVVAAPLLGAALGAYELCRDSTRQRVGTYTGAKLADLGPVQIKLAEAASSIEAARLLLRANCDEMMRRAEAGDHPAIEDRARYRGDGAFAAKLALRAVDIAVELTGAAGLYTKNPMQRHFRDAHAISHHVAVVWDVAAQIYGAATLGLPPLLPTV